MSKAEENRDFPEGCSIVFGGSGGLGRGIATLLALRGSAVVVVYQSSSAEAANATEEIVNVGGEVNSLQGDVTDAHSVASIFEDSIRRYRRVHTVVMAQGLRYIARAAADTRLDEYRKMIEVEVFGFLNVAKAAVPAMRAAGGGSIIAITRSAVRRTYPNMTIAATPKVAVEAICTQIAIEEGASGIRVNTVGPGVIAAGMAISMTQAAPESRQLIEYAVAATPLRRVGTAQEVAEAVAFLASTKASFISGQHIMVDGGLSAG